ncbi:MAG: hypothetical protein HY270_14650 [Deltaproteobacteria bacterium]|nr:hypothetical protein [Deltaproteobacteria bacterium]
MPAPPTTLPFDLAAATQCLSENDACLKRLIAELPAFEIDLKEAVSPYEALLEAIAYQSISGKAAATIFGRVKALSGGDRVTTSSNGSFRCAASARGRSRCS